MKYTAVTRDTQKQFRVERDTLSKRKKQILRQIRGEQELLDKVYDEMG